jgi:hypothetical protein
MDLCEPSQKGWFLERPHMQIQTDFSWGLISRGRRSDLRTLRMREFVPRRRVSASPEIRIYPALAAR